MAVDLLSSSLSYVLLLTDRWLQFIVAPLKNFDLLWLAVPVLLNWILNEYFQERKGTSYGNAIANGFVMFWVGLDFSRTIVNNFAKKGFASLSALHVVMTLVILIYGSLVMYEAVKGRRIAHLIGRIREVTYFSIISIGVIYNAVVFDINTLIAVIVFFPVFYFAVETALKILPPPEAELEEELEQGGSQQQVSTPEREQYQQPSAAMPAQGYRPVYRRPPPRRYYRRRYR